MTKIGVGTLYLAQSNSYSGGTSVNAGILEMQNGNALGATSGTIAINGDALGGGPTTGGAIALGGGVTTNPGYAITIYGQGPNYYGQLQNDTGNNTWAGPVTLGGIAGSGDRVGCANANASLTISGLISGSGELIVRSNTVFSGTTAANLAGSYVILSNSANNYTGGTLVFAGGAVQLGANNGVSTAGNLDISTPTLSSTSSYAQPSLRPQRIQSSGHRP